MCAHKSKEDRSRIVVTSGSVNLSGDVKGSVIITGDGNVTASDRSIAVKPSDVKEWSTRRLIELLSTRFTMHEISRIAFELGVDYDNLAGMSKHEKAAALINYLDQRDRLRSLVEVVGESRPDVSLDSVIQR
jgi:hypothetical protein